MTFHPARPSDRSGSSALSAWGPGCARRPRAVLPTTRPRITAEGVITCAQLELLDRPMRKAFSSSGEIRPRRPNPAKLGASAQADEAEASHLVCTPRRALIRRGSILRRFANRRVPAGASAGTHGRTRNSAVPCAWLHPRRRASPRRAAAVDREKRTGRARRRRRGHLDNSASEQFHARGFTIAANPADGPQELRALSAAK